MATLNVKVVLHVAAYKHVPMMELHPWEAIYNNILGTKYTLEVAQEFGVERFILVSCGQPILWGLRKGWRRSFCS